MTAREAITQTLELQGEPEDVAGILGFDASETVDALAQLTVVNYTQAVTALAAGQVQEAFTSWVAQGYIGFTAGVLYARTLIREQDADST